MSELSVVPSGSLGRNFIEGPYLPEGRDEYYLRNEQSPHPPDHWRRLRADEIEALVRNDNEADDWDTVLVTDEFCPRHVRNCEFYGLVRIGRLREAYLEYHDLRVPVGLTGSRIIACDIGDDAAIHSVRYLAHYIVGDRVILLNIDEMHCTNHAKFGNGIVKEGEAEDVRIWLELVNEAGGREVMPFDGMTTGDAWLWARHRDDPDLVRRLGEVTQASFDARRGFYGTVGAECVIKTCRIIKDVKVGPNAYIKGANKLKNLTINSSPEQPSQIGEGVELVNGIIGYGCHIFYGCKAVRFILGENSNLKYGARLIHSFLGDNSTVSCCELLNNLIFPAHEQHHNNSFLIAAQVDGQSNIAACATIGSNHNSRAPDGEIHAGRGFWPGLCVSLKHNSRFAPFCLIAKGDYPLELDVPLPFCLLSTDVAADRRQLLPGYWWLYNMYALARNAWKFGSRDKRLRKVQNVEFESLAPDTAEALTRGMVLLERWVGQAKRRADGEDPAGADDAALRDVGRALLEGPADAVDALEVIAEDVEKSHRPVLVLKVHAGYAAYRDMLTCYAVRNLLAWMEAHPGEGFEAMKAALDGERVTEWVNMGGQVARRADVTTLRADIKAGTLQTWDDIHAACDALWEAYPGEKQRHALAVLRDLAGGALTAEAWQAALDEGVRIQQYICDQTFDSRRKDFESHFRRMCYASDEEMEAVLGSAEGNSFVRQTREETAAFAERVAAVKARG